jgi:formiminoglutamate deiminase
VSVWWCELAVLPAGVCASVTIDVSDGIISKVTPATAPPLGATRLSGLTVPGFANSHSHAFHRALRSRVQAGSGSFWTWREVMYDTAGRLDPDSYHRLARAVYAEMASAGYTAVGEFHYLHHQPDGTPYADANAMGEALLAAARDAGIRITLLDTLYRHGGLSADGYLAPSGVQLRYCDRNADTWANRVSALDPGPDQQVGAAIHSVRAVEPASIAAVAEWATAADAPLHAHVSEQVAENEACRAHHHRSPVELLDNAGALGTHFSAVHATHVSKSDIRRLGQSRAGVCFCPSTERDLGDGIGPSTELAAAGVALHLGSDSHAVIDPLEEARALELHERLRTQRRGCHSTDRLLAMSTENGHAALGWPDAGVIEAGRRADLTTVRLDTVRGAGAPLDCVDSSAVFCATAADVTTVISGGREVVSNGRHRTIDVAAELDATIKELFA